MDRAGNTVVRSSDGVLVDATPPDVGVVRDGAGAAGATDAHGPLRRGPSAILHPHILVYMENPYRRNKSQ